MTQKLKLKVTENGITRDAKLGEITSWNLLRLESLCNDVITSGDCDKCPMCNDGSYSCWINIHQAHNFMVGKEIILEVIDE